MVQLGKIDVIVWDLDGVLVDTEPDLKASFREAARAVGFGELSDEQVSNRIGGGAKKALAGIFGDQQDDYLEPALAHFKEYYPRHSAIHSVLYPGVEQTLRSLRGRVRMAVATAKIRSAASEILETLGIAPYIDHLVSADEMTRMKPDPQSILVIHEHFGVAPEKAVMIGDMATDIEAAHGAGSPAIAVSYGYGKKEDLIAAEPELMIDSPTELLPLIG